jgi:universal stress protein A
MDLKNILCPIDFSNFNQAANKYASMLADSSGAKITYLHVSLPDVAYGTYVYVDMNEQEARDRKRLEEIKPTIDGIEAFYAVEFGSPSDRIVEYAKENGVDLIVMGTHGRTGLGRVIMGSVAEAVVRRAECPVLALKSDSKVPHSVE